MKIYTKNEIDSLRRINGNMVMSTVHMASITGVSVENMNKFIGSAIEKLVRNGMAGQETLRYDATYKNSPMSDVVMECTLIEWKVYSTVIGIVTKTIGDKLREEWKLFHEDVYGVATETSQKDIIEVEVIDAVAEDKTLQVSNFELEEFGITIRAGVIDNGPVFHAKDVAEALDYTNTYRAIQNLEEKQGVSLNCYPFITNGGTQSVKFLTEKELYLMVMNSKKKEAVDFQMWIAGTVLPQIRKTGSFSPVNNKQAQIPTFSDPVEAARAWADAEEGKQKAIGVIKHKDGVINKKNEQIKSASAMSIEAGESTISEFVKALGIKGFGLKTCFVWLREHEYLMKNGEPYQKWINKSYFKHKPWKDDDGKRARFQPILEARGRLALSNEIRKEFEELEGVVA